MGVLPSWVRAAVVGTVAVALMPSSAMAAPMAYKAEPLGAAAPNDEPARPHVLDKDLDIVIEEVHAKLAAIRQRPHLQTDASASTVESAVEVAERFRHLRAEMADQLAGLRQRLNAAERTMWQLWPDVRPSPDRSHGLIGFRWPTGHIERRSTR